MDSFELNKILGAVLGVCMLALGLNILAGEMFKPRKPVVAGYALPEPTAAVAAAPAAAQVEPLPVRLATADLAKGQTAARKCASCHTFENGGANRVGPNLYNVVAGSKAHIDGFGYSAALKERAAKGEKWGYEELDKFLENPRGYLAGTSMAFAGIKDPKERADILVYLRSLAPTPAPLPTP